MGGHITWAVAWIYGTNAFTTRSIRKGNSQTVSIKFPDRMCIIGCINESVALFIELQRSSGVN